MNFSYYGIRSFILMVAAGGHLTSPELKPVYFTTYPDLFILRPSD